MQFFASALVAAFSSYALELGSPFVDGAVLQRDKPVRVWGFSVPGEQVKVSFAGQERCCVAGEDGRWTAVLTPMPADATSRELVAESPSGRLVVRDVVVGEVWLAGGQSNMQFPLCGDNPRFRDRDGGLTAQMTSRPLVRYVNVPRRASLDAQRKTSTKLSWERFEPKVLSRREVSAVGVYYALELHAALGVPVGIVSANWGGTDIAPWIPRVGLERQEGIEDIAAWRPKAPEDFTDADKTPTRTNATRQPTLLYNGMVAPLAPYAFRGIIWYQGESDRGDATRYALKMHAYFDGMRKVMKDPSLKLYFCQIAPWGGGSSTATEIREQQARFAMEEPNADMAVTADVGNMNEIHPYEKATVAKRLAAFALHNDYGWENVEPWPPTPVGAVCETGGVVAVGFVHAEKLGVYRLDRKLDLDFEIAGADGKFVPAELLTSADPETFLFKEPTLRFAAKGVAEPKKIRHQHRPPYFGELVNRTGLPCGPFTLDVQPADFDPIAWICGRIAADEKNIVLPYGRYVLEPRDGKYLELRDLKDVTIDFSGSFFWGRRRVTMLSLVDCVGVTVKNLKIDYPFDLPFSQGVIEKIGPDGEWDVLVDEGYSDQMDWSWPVQAYDAKTHALVNPMRFLKEMTLTKLGPRRIRVAGGENRRAKAGDIAVWSVGRGRGFGVFPLRCSQCVFDNIAVYSTPSGRGFEEWSGEDGNVYRRCRIVPCPPEDDPVERARPRLRSGNHDAFNSRSQKVGPVYDFCEARNHCDDDVNINGGYWFISSVTGNVVRAVATDEYCGTFVCGPVQLMMPDGTVPIDLPEVVSCREASGPDATERERLASRGLVFQLANNINHAFEFTLARADDRFCPGAVFVSQNAGGNHFRIVNCRFGPNRARALILNASYGVVENCVFDRTEGQAIRAASSCPWLEGGCAREVTVKDCVFYDADCYFGANLGPGRMLPAFSHRDVAVCDNVFAGRSRLLVHGCTGLTISNNVFDCAEEKAIELKNTEDVRRLSPRSAPQNAVRAAAIYRPHGVFKSLKAPVRPRFGNDFDGGKPETLAAEAQLAASVGLDAFVFSGDPGDTTFVAAVEAFLNAPDVGGLRFAVQCDPSRRRDIPTVWLESPRCWRENGQPKVFDMALETLVAGPTANAFEEKLAKAPEPVVLDAWNDYAKGRTLIPDYHAGDACLRAVARRFGRRPADRYVFALGGGLKLKDVPRATHENLAYGPHDKHHLDLWLPKDAEGTVPLLAYVHGGGWMAGEIVDSGVPRLLADCLPKGIAVAAIGYRFVSDAEADGVTPPVRAPYEDCLAAMRYLKANAGRFGLDETRFGMTGGSAGGCTILLLALKDSNPLGLKAVWTEAAQTTLDPFLHAKWLPKLRYGAQAFGMSFDEFVRRRDEIKPLIDDWSPLALLEKADRSKLPMMTLRYDHHYSNGLYDGNGADDSVHDAAFGFPFKEACDRLGIACHLLAPGLQAKGIPYERGL
ncbi:MAG: alpha/beta hydrolase fold domain-containing protein [Kiritimatiellae bacterium]|nr:alpha/beta hydrolase fold domain-containing protein [Kiritimatiellia bacterium]